MSFCDHQAKVSDGNQEHSTFNIQRPTAKRFVTSSSEGRTAQRGPRSVPDGQDWQSRSSKIGDLKFKEKPMILRKLNQIRPDQTGAFASPNGVRFEHGHSHAKGTSVRPPDAKGAREEALDRINRRDRIGDLIVGESGEVSADGMVTPQSAGGAGKSGRSATASTIFGQHGLGGPIYPGKSDLIRPK